MLPLIKKRENHITNKNSVTHTKKDLMINWMIEIILRSKTTVITQVNTEVPHVVSVI